MSAGFINQTEIMGYVGQNPKAIKMENGDQVVYLSIGTTDRWTDKQTKEEREHTEWHNVAIFGRTAEVAMKYVTKGSRILVKGKLKTRKSTDKNGIDRWNTSIAVSELHLLGDRRDKSEEDISQDHDFPPTAACQDDIASHDYARASKGAV